MTRRQRLKINNLKKRFKLRTWVTVGVLLVLLPIALLALYNPSESQAEWFDENWQYRKKLTIDNDPGSAQSNVRVKFDIDTAALIPERSMQSDCDDARFTDFNGRHLRYFLDSASGACDTTSTDFWVLIDYTIPANTDIYVYFYYGNLNAQKGSEPQQFSESIFTPNGTTVGSEEKGLSPTGWWKFDEGVDNTCSGGTNDTCDSGSSANNGAITGGAAWKQEELCLSGKCLFFDGSDDVVTVTNADAIDFDTGLVSAVTFAAWVKVNTDGEASVGEIFNKGTNTYLRTTNDGGGADLEAKLDLATTDATATVTDGLILNKWHHVAMTYTDDADDDISVYIDGELRATGDGSGAPASTDTNNLLIGGSSGANYHGFIDDFRVYNYEKTKSQVKAIAQIQAAGGGSSSAILGASDTAFLNDGLNAFWNLNELSGTSATDSSGNSNTLTLTNMEETGTAEAASSDTTIVDADNTNLSTTDDVYIGMRVRITGGASCDVDIPAGTTRIISDYVGSTRTITVEETFDNVSSGAVDQTDNCTFEIRHHAMGKYGTGLYFDDDNDTTSVTENGTLDLTTGLSISAWVKTDASEADNVIFSKGTSYEVGVDASGNLYWDGVGSQQDDGSAKVTSATWHHVAVTNDDTTVTYYVDGVSTGTDSAGIDADNNTAAIIGGDGTNSYDGKIDELRVYSRVLSSSEINKFYSYGPGPLSYWTFDTVSGTTIFDTSGYKASPNNATADSTINYVPGKFGSAVHFDSGVSEDVTMGDPSDESLDFQGDDDFTISLWAKMRGATGGSQNFLNKNFGGDFGGYRIRAATTAVPSCGISDSQAGTEEMGDSNIVANDNIWYFISCVVKQDPLGETDDNFFIFINATFTNSHLGIAGESGPHSNAGSLTIGANPNSYSVELDDLRFYNYARSPAQILQDKNAGTQAAGALSDSTSTYWSLDETQGQTINDANKEGAFDNSIILGRTTGVTSTDPTWKTASSCKFNGCLDFDGTDDQLLSTNPAPDTGEFGSTSAAASFWMKADTIGDGETMIYVGDFDTAPENQGDNEMFFLRWDTTSGNDIEYGHENGSGGTDNTNIFDTNLSTGTWYHVVFSRDNDLKTVRLYINGKQVGSTYSYTNNPDYFSDAGSGDNDNSTQQIAIGSNSDGTAGTFFDGIIDEVKFYLGPLTLEQILLDMNANTTANFTGVGQIEAAQLADGAGTGPILIWKLDENKDNTCTNGTDDACDTSGNGNDGAATNSPTWVPAKYGSGLRFSDSTSDNDYVTIADDADLDFAGADSFTISTWFKHGSASAQEVILGKYDSGTLTDGGYKILMESDGDITCGIDDNNTSFPLDFATSTAATYDDSNWHQATCVKNGSTSLTLYIDGIQVAQDTSITANTLANGDAFFYGIDSEDGTSGDFIGSVDHLVITRAVRTQAQVAYDFNRGRPIGWWKLDECQGTTAYDSSGNGNNGTISPGDTTGDNDTVGTCGSGVTTEMWNDGTTGKRNGSLGFDNTNDNLDYNDVAILDVDSTATGTSLTDFTITGWFKRATTNTTDVIVAKRNSITTATDVGYILYMSGGGAPDNFNFEISDAENDEYSMTATEPTNDTNWHHFALVWDDDSGGSGGNTKVYIDGKDSNETHGGTIGNIGNASNSVDFKIGDESDATSTTGQSPFSGQIDDIRVYNYALSQTQVLKIISEDAASRFGPDTGSP